MRNYSESLLLQTSAIVVMSSVSSVCVCVSVCPGLALTFESLELQTLFLCMPYICRISGSSSCIKVKVKVTVAKNRDIRASLHALIHGRSAFD